MSSQLDINTQSDSLTIIGEGGDTYTARMNNGMSYSIDQKGWPLRHDYYLDMSIDCLPTIIDELKKEGNPLNNILEMGIARGVLSIGIALLLNKETSIVGVDIDPGSQAMVAKNAKANGVDEVIKVRIGDFFEPIKPEESFDLIFGELPINVVDPQRTQEYIAAGYGIELQNISGGAEGRDFIDPLVTRGIQYLKPGGAIMFVQPSFISADRTLALFEENNLTGSIAASQEWLLNDTKFTKMNRPYIEAVYGDIFEKRADGEDIFHLLIMKGVKKG